MKVKNISIREISINLDGENFIINLMKGGNAD